MVTASYKSTPKVGEEAAGRIYRVTAVGFGPRSDVQVVMQALIRN